MLSYPLDLEKPYTVLSFNDRVGTYMVSGIAKTLHAHIPEKTIAFGGHPAIFILRKNEFLSIAQKNQLRWVKKHIGDRQHDLLENELYDLAIANHAINPD